MYNETTRMVKVVMPDNAGDGIVSGDSPLLASATTTDSDAIMLSDTAENLYIAYEVVAMVKDEETGKTHFSQLRWKKLGTIEDEDGGEAKSVADPSGDGDGEQIGVKGAMRDGMGAATEEELPLYYQFMFESGDLFVAAAADEYPALDGEELQMLSDSSSGGGSGGDNNTEIVSFTITYDSENDTYGATCDHTLAQIDAARIAGKDIVPIIYMPNRDGIAAYVAKSEFLDDGEEKSYTASHDEIMSGLAGLSRSSIRCAIYSDDDPIYVEVHLSSDMNIGAAFYVKEANSALDKNYEEIHSALSLNGNIVYVHKGSGFTKAVEGIIVSAEYDDSVPRYDVYGLVLSSGSISTVHWKSTTSSGTLTRV